MPWKPETLALHGGHTPDSETRSRAVPIYQTTSYVFDSPEHAASLFNLQPQVWEPRLTQEQAGEQVSGPAGNIYTRIMNPTTDVLERRMSLLEQGIGALALSSGSSAVAFALMTICQSGDHVVSSRSLYGGTHHLLQQTLPQYGIHTSFTPDLEPRSFVQAITESTKCFFVETLGNPRLDIPDLAALAQAAHAHSLPLIVDNTIATPFLCQPIAWGADVVVHSLTKFCAGHGTSMGGAIIDSGRFDWAGSGRFPQFSQPDPSLSGQTWPQAVGAAAYIMRARNVLLRDLGACLAPMNSWLILQGLETLALRMERHCANAQAVAEFLQQHPKVNWVLYPGLSSHPDHDLAQRYLAPGFGAMIGFGVQGGLQAGQNFIQNLKLFSHLANIGDAKSLAIHPGSTTHAQLSPNEQLALGLSPDFIRLSVGLEHIDDLLTDLDQALDKS